MKNTNTPIDDFTASLALSTKAAVDAGADPAMIFHRLASMTAMVGLRQAPIAAVQEGFQAISTKMDAELASQKQNASESHTDPKCSGVDTPDGGEKGGKE